MRNTERKNPLEVAVKKFVDQKGIKNVLVALSGGADSITLAYVLKRIGLNIKALHCNFHLRGEESNRDMEFVENFCNTNSIPLQIKEFDTIDFLKRNKGISPEMACRDLRHSWFKQKLTEEGFQRLAIGHNADDNIETFFLNLMRGAGSRGLKGMVMDNGVIWRPFLKVHREEILEYINQNNLSFIIDSTNLENDYRRNFLRNRIIPLFKSEWEGFETSLDRSLDNLERENSVVEYSLKNILDNNRSSLDIDIILEFPDPLLLIKRFIEPAGPYKTTPQEVLAAIKARKPHIPMWNLQNGRLYIRKNHLFIEMVHGESCS